MNRNLERKVGRQMRSLESLYGELKDYLINEKNYVVISSCNADKTEYLVPKGTENEISYYGKPEKSFRFSDHWNWYANLKKCSNPDYVQCYNESLPCRNGRINEKATFPYYAGAIAVFTDGSYKTIAGAFGYGFYKPSFNELVDTVNSYI